MNLLSIDTSTEHASVALLFNGMTFYEEQTQQKTHAQCLLPMIDKLMNTANASWPLLDAVVFGCGPGSFTGLRIACSVAKGLAYAHDLKLIPVSSLEAIIFAARQQEKARDKSVLAVLDARMGELYWRFSAGEGDTSPEQVTKAEQISVITKSPLIVAGVGIDSYWEQFPESIKERTSCRLNLYPSALAMIEWVEHSKPLFISAAQAQPIYIRNQVTQGATGG
ncbi:MAG: tRNA (adenosine(37)-N6)-threonylcarbamoyltransferase complex dimerization subunit type 1 TsaB [Legionella sp.]|nr:MAG: tRNA (adenosine(37)-N6)-threonylcarbamoyltransferase complex dimerization subunit type 1 TsaB [Legionella sp.]PJD99554.1 MAG: tRNA (adenosine(37)-N6)-threonylcarbamoyltransferase complex dimerization subunit type 1 TsaB [Legionella sp.]